MSINENVLQKDEKIIFALRELYMSHGFKAYRMGKFEEYDLYAGNKDFLVSDNVITFTDMGGKLMALRPDVTLSIIKNSIDAPDEVTKVFYNENVYRVSKSSGSYSEIMQSGVECFGNIGYKDVYETLMTASQALSMLSKDYTLAVSDLDIISETVGMYGLTAADRRKMYEAIGQRNIDEIKKLCGDMDSIHITGLLNLPNEPEKAIAQLDDILFYDESYPQFRKAITELIDAGVNLSIDFSVVSDLNYYNGIVFKGYIKGIPEAVLSGGRYDKLMRKLGRASGAIGFAVYTDELERIEIGEEKKDDGYLNIALPKGRLGDKVYDMFAKAGFECPSILEPNRKLIFENEDTKVRYFWVKPSDVAIYVERGAADIGVAGKDILLEYEPKVYELMDLNMGKCRMAVAAPKDFDDNGEGTLRVATKFANIAKKYYMSKGRDIDIIHLNGSIEIAPILGLSDVIVDIVETGTTLKENNLEVKETVVPISARLISNKTAYKFKGERINKIVSSLNEIKEQ